MKPYPCKRLVILLSLIFFFALNAQDLERKFLSGEMTEGGGGGGALGSGGDAARMHELEEQLRAGGVDPDILAAKDIKIQALEEQMLENAREFADKLSEMTTKLFEYEAMALTADDGSDGGV